MRPSVNRNSIVSDFLFWVSAGNLKLELNSIIHTFTQRHSTVGLAAIFA